MSKKSPLTARLSVESLEDRTTPTFLPNPAGPLINVNGINQPTGGLSIAAGNLFQIRGDPASGGLGAVMEYVTGTGPGVNSLVRIYDSQSGELLGSWSPFPGFKGGVNVAVGDVLGTGAPQIIVVPASGGPPVVAVFDANGNLLNQFLVNGNTTFTGGLNVAVGNVLGGISAGGFSDGLVSSQFPQQIILGTASQAAIVVVTDGYGNTQRTFDASPGFTGGIVVAAANLDSTRDPAFTFGGGVPDTNAYAEIIVGAATQIPAVATFDVWQGGVTQRSAFMAFNPDNRQTGVTLAAGPTAGAHEAQIFVSLVGTSTVEIYDGYRDTYFSRFNVYPAGYSGVINLVVGYFTPGGYDPSDDDTLGGDNFFFDTQSLAVVAGDGPFQQQPRYFVGQPGAPAGLNGP